MILEEEFNKNIEDWKEHCKKTIHSSNLKDDIDCDAYRNIINMGTSVLPLIRKEYGANPKEDIEKTESLKDLLVNPVKEIIGDDFEIPKWMRGKISVIAKYTAKWLDENMDKYVKRI